MIQNQKGQALAENVVCLLTLIFLVGAFFLLAYQLALSKWTDFWSYRALICLAEHKQVYFCKNQLTEKMNLLLSSQKYRIEEIWITRNQAKIKLSIESFGFADTFIVGMMVHEKRIVLPLVSP